MIGRCLTLTLLRTDDLRHVQPARAQIAVEWFNPAAAGLQAGDGFLHLVPPQEGQRIRVGLPHIALSIELGAEIRCLGDGLAVL